MLVAILLPVIFAATFLLGETSPLLLGA